MTASFKKQTLDVTQAEWKKINEFTHSGQHIMKQSSFGYHRRRLTIKNNILSWQSKSIPLKDIRKVTIGDPPKKRFRKTDGNPALWITIDGEDRRFVSLLFHDISSRNFWILSIIIYMGHLENPRFVESIEKLQSALNVDAESTNGTTHILTLSPNGSVRPEIQSDHEPVGGHDVSTAPFTGNVQFHIICASNLPKADMISNSDPYVMITNHLGHSVKTKTIWNSHNPMWNEHLSLDIHAQHPLTIQIFDEDQHCKDTVLCSCVMNMATECTAATEVKFHRKMEVDASFTPKLSTLTFTALYTDSIPPQRPFIDIPDICTASPSIQDGDGTDIQRDTLESQRSMISSHSTSDLHVDYLDLHALHRKQNDLFRDMASSIKRSERGLFDEPSIFSQSARDTNPDTTSRMNTGSIRSDSSELPLSNHTGSNLIEVEENPPMMDHMEIQRNPRKLYIVIGQMDIAQDIPPNVCHLDLDSIIAAKDEQTGVQCIDRQIECISLKLFGSEYPRFECLVLPKGDALEKQLSECSPALFTHFGRGFESLIESIRLRNDRNTASLDVMNAPISSPPSHCLGVTRDHTNNAMNPDISPLSLCITNPSPNRPKPPPIIIPIGEGAERVESADDPNGSPNNPVSHSTPSNNEVKRSCSKPFECRTIPQKALSSLGVEALTKLTITLMRNGESFNVYGPFNGPPTVSTVYLCSDRGGLRILEDVSIPFAHILSLHDGNSDVRFRTDLSASFGIEYAVNGDVGTTAFVVLEVMEREKCLSRRNWWIKSLISCLAHYEPHRFPPSISVVSKLLSAITEDGNPCTVPFVDIEEIEDTFSITTSASLDMVSVDTESARRRAAERVRRYKKLQEDVQNMANQSRTKRNNEVKRMSKSIAMDSVPFVHEDIINIAPSATKMTQHISTKKDLNSAPLHTHKVGSNSNQEPVAEIDAVPDQIAVDAVDENRHCVKSIRFERPSDAVAMRSTITNLTRKLQEMECLQMAQTLKVKQFVERESTVITRYQREIKRLRRQKQKMDIELKTMRNELDETDKQRIDVERRLKLKQWDRAKNSKQKENRERSEVSKLRQGMEILNGKLEKANNGYKSAMTNYHREQQQRLRLERHCGRLEQRYVCDTQQTKDDLLEMTRRNAELKRQCKALQHSQGQIEKNEKNVQQLLSVEIDRSRGLQNQMDALRLRLQSVSAQQSRIDEQRDKEQKESGLREMRQRNEMLTKQKQTLQDQVGELQSTLREKDMVLNEKEKEIDKLNDDVQNIPLQFQQKLIDFTQYAQEQMTLQQQTLMKNKS